MPALSEEWRRRAAQSLGAIGDRVPALQESLTQAGYQAFLPVQATLLGLAESQQEVEEFQTFLKETAKETIGAIWATGDQFAAGDGFASPFLERQRQRRDREIGTRRDFGRSATESWKFEINSLVGRLGRLREKDEEVYQKLMALQEAEIHAVKKREAPAVYPRREDELKFAFDIDRRLEHILEGIGIAGLKGAAIGSIAQIERFVPLVGIPIGGSWTFGMCLTDLRSLRNQGSNLCVLDHWLFLTPGTPERVVGRTIRDTSHVHQLRLCQAILGFNTYLFARSFGEIVLGVLAQLRLMALCTPALGTCTERLSDGRSGEASR